jgi:AcrR family transcriptional regulator
LARRCHNQLTPITRTGIPIPVIGPTVGGQRLMGCSAGGKDLGLDLEGVMMRNNSNWWKATKQDVRVLSDLRGVQQPKQERSQKSFDEIILAAKDLMYEHGLEGATVKGVLEKSGVSASSFYGKFEGRDSLLEYMACLFWLAAEREWGLVLDSRRWRGGGTRPLVEQLMKMLVMWFRAEEAVLRAFLLHALSGADETNLKRISEFDNWLADETTGLLIERKEEIGHTAPGLAIRVATLQAVATVRSRLLFLGKNMEDGISDRRLSQEMSRGFLGHLNIVQQGSTASLR